uniref:Uncharacterized protein n=1 Tax=Anopheles albimanus TaxID=7167 RepID=A0A182FYD9_ANOAL
MHETVDEIQQYVDARYISASQAVSTIFGFEMQAKTSLRTCQPSSCIHALDNMLDNVHRLNADQRAVYDQLTQAVDTEVLARSKQPIVQPRKKGAIFTSSTDPAAQGSRSCWKPSWRIPDVNRR